MIEMRTCFREQVAGGIAAGVVGGVSLVLAEVAVAVALGASPLAPIRLIGSIVLGPAAISPAFPFVLTVPAFVAVHLTLSAVYGLVFSFLVAQGNRFRAQSLMILLLGVGYGTVVSLVNVTVVAPVAWPQFSAIDQLWEGLIPHAFFFGLPLAAYLVYTRGQVLEHKGLD